MSSSTNTTPSKTTPMMAQWAACKKQAEGAFLLFRLGDFYEAFHEDAEKLSKLLDLTLTKRQEVPMCGIPWHSSEGYIEKLISLGFSVAIAEQKAGEDTQLMERQIVRILSPATALTPGTIEPSQHTLFIALHAEKELWAASIIDVTSSLFEGLYESDTRIFIQEVVKRKPKELLVSHAFLTKHASLIEQLQAMTGASLSKAAHWMFDLTAATETIKAHFQVKTLDAFQMNDKPPLIQAVGAHLSYLKNTLLFPTETLSNFTLCQQSQAMQLDRSTIENLELFESTSTLKGAKSLYDLLNSCVTPMGSRALRTKLLFPLQDKREIERRQDNVQGFIDCIENHIEETNLALHHLSSIRDLERTCLRIHSGSFGPRDVLALGLSLKAIQPLKKALQPVDRESVTELLALEPCDELANEILHTLQDVLPLRSTEGNLIRPHINKELDELKSMKQDASAWLVSYQNRLREELNIRTLKVGFTRAFGYYIEVSRGLSEKMPSSFVRRQTLTTQERFISEELKAFEQKIFTADARILALETELFDRLVSSVRSKRDLILTYAKKIADVDLFFAFARQAKERNYVKPSITTDSRLSIEQGRHPVIERSPSCPHFTPNDVVLDSKGPSLLLLTGPNMGGKSTYIRQAALITIMAHIGSFVPAKKASICLVDKVMSRVGASDDLARGQSTFMVEMTETAHIMRSATSSSLLLLDEVGRGTSTFDGIAIAQAVLEKLISSKGSNPKTLFATHYFELTSLEQRYPSSVHNRTVAVSENEKTIQFLHHVIDGKADKSYGIHVASLAGMPQDIITRAKEFLSLLESEKKQEGFLFSVAPKPTLTKKEGPEQLCYQFIKALDLNKLSPLECFMKLIKLKDSIHTETR